MLAHPRRDYVLNPVHGVLSGVSFEQSNEQLGTTRGYAFSLDGASNLLYARAAPHTRERWLL